MLANAKIAEREADEWKANNSALKFLFRNVKKLLAEKRAELTAKEKITLRLFRTDARRFLAQAQHYLM